MKVVENRLAWLLIIINLSICSAILSGNGQIHEEITSNPKYGCHWSGGSNAMVNCTCREDAEEFYIRKGEVPVYNTWAIEINNCKKVTFGEHSIADLRNLRNLHLTNIDSLNLNPESLNWFGYRANHQTDEEADDENIPSLNIYIENSRIDLISQYTFKGRIKEIKITDCEVKDMESFAFSSLRQSETVSLKNTNVQTIRPQAFKLFKTKELILDNVTINTLPSRTFSNLLVDKNLKITNSKFDTLYPGAFMIDGPRWFEVSNSKIVNMDGEAFTVKVKGDVHFKNNVIGVVNPGAFVGINPSRDLVINTALYLVLESNLVSSFWTNSLQVNGLVLKLLDLKINESCNCVGFMNRYSGLEESFSELKCLDSNHYVSLKDYNSVQCTILSGHTTMIVVISVVCLLLLIIAGLLFFYYHRAYKAGKYGNEKEQPTKNVSLIVPDGRTYRETEVHVILERADLLTTDL